MKFVLSILVFFLVLSPWTAWSETPEPSVTAYRDWVVICVERQDRTICTMRQTQNYKSEEISGRLMTATVGKTRDGSLILELLLPLGLDLRPGIAIQIDDHPKITASFFTCTKDGCLVLVPLDAKQLTLFQKGNLARVAMRPLGSDKAVVINISLMGFSRAYREIQ